MNHCGQCVNVDVENENPEELMLDILVPHQYIQYLLIIYKHNIMAAHPKTEFHSQMFLVHFFRRDDFGIHDEVALTIFAPTYFRSYILDRHVPSSYSSSKQAVK